MKPVRRVALTRPLLPRSGHWRPRAERTRGGISAQGSCRPRSICPDSCGRRQPLKQRVVLGLLAQARTPRRCRPQWTRSGKGCGIQHLRFGVHGLPDARIGRLRSDSANKEPLRSLREGAHRGADSERDAGRPGTLSRSRDDHYVTKPVDVRRFAAALQRFLPTARAAVFESV